MYKMVVRWKIEARPVEDIPDGDEQPERGTRQVWEVHQEKRFFPADDPHCPVSLFDLVARFRLRRAAELRVHFLMSELVNRYGVDHAAITIDGIRDIGDLIL